MTRMSIDEYKQLQGQAKPNKYKAIKTVVDGITFDSRLEAKRYCELKLLKAAGEIRWFHRQPSFILRVDRYRPDFIVCGKDGCIWVEDAKGKETEVWKKKAKEWALDYPDIELKIVK